ncbi:MAG: heavy-metal-associated domain-containing protein [Gemmatimonadota bacterium]
MPRADGSSEQTVQFVTAEFEVDGMSCGGCALATELALKKLDGVASAVAEYDDETGEGRCTVEYDPALVSPNRLITTINDVGFVATPLTGTQGES